MVLSVGGCCSGGVGGDVGGDEVGGRAFQFDDSADPLEVGGEAADVAVDRCENLGLLAGEDLLVQEVREARVGVLFVTKRVPAARGRTLEEIEQKSNPEVEEATMKAAAQESVAR